VDKYSVAERDFHANLLFLLTSNHPFSRSAMQINRRTFIRTTALSGAGLSVLGSQAFGSSNSPVRLAYLSDSPDQKPTYAADWATSALFTATDSAAFQQLIRRADIDLIVADVSSRYRSPVAQAAMKAGKPIAFTAPIGQNVRDILNLMMTHEQTGTPCLLLNDDPFSRDVMAVSTMIQKRQFGDLTYIHCGSESETNGLDAAIEWLGINQSNRFTSLTASISRSWGLHEPAVTAGLKNESFVRNYELGEVLTITLQCANGQTVVVSRDLKGKRPYEQGFRVQGTEGYWLQENDVVVRQGKSQAFTALKSQFDHPAWEANGNRRQPKPNALTTLTRLLQTGTLPPHSTQNALTIGLVHAVAKQSLSAWSEDVEVPALSTLAKMAV
jgi:predicted dehydrogenase